MAYIAALQARDDDEARMQSRLQDKAREPVDRHSTGPQELLWKAALRVATIDKVKSIRGM